MGGPHERTKTGHEQVTRRSWIASVPLFVPCGGKHPGMFGDIGGLYPAPMPMLRSVGHSGHAREQSLRNRGRCVLAGHAHMSSCFGVVLAGIVDCLRVVSACIHAASSHSTKTQNTHQDIVVSRFGVQCLIPGAMHPYTSWAFAGSTRGLVPFHGCRVMGFVSWGLRRANERGVVEGGRQEANLPSSVPLLTIRFLALSSPCCWSDSRAPWHPDRQSP